jgi:hypothetical protein
MPIFSRECPLKHLVLIKIKGEILYTVQYYNKYYMLATITSCITYRYTT